MRASKVVWEVKPAILYLEDLPGFRCQKVFRFAGRQERGDQLLAGADAGEGHRMCCKGDRRYYNSYCTCRLRYRRIRSAERPTASECHVHAQTESARFVRREAQILDKFIGEIGEIVKAALGIVEVKRVDGLNFDSSDSAFLHLAKFARKFRLRHRRPEPPPAHQDPAVVRRIREVLTQYLQFGCRPGWPGRIHEETRNNW